jgi:sarcosine oxidase, subunit beta
VLCDRAEVASGATAKAMGGVRQQFSTAAEVRLAQASITFFEELGAPLFEQVGYLFVATTEEGLAELEARRALQVELGVPVERVDAGAVRGLDTGDVLGATACWRDGVAEPSAVTRELVARAAELGVAVRERTSLAEVLVEGDACVIACGAQSAAVAESLGVDLPVRPLRRQLIETESVAGLPRELPMVIEAESGFHFRRRGDRLVLAMTDPEPRWGAEEVADESLVPDRLARLAHRCPTAAGIGASRVWAGLYDMTPDAHPILGGVAEGVYAACGFSGHGFMVSPAVGAALAELILDGESSFDLTPYRLARFDTGAIFPETLVL